MYVGNKTIILFTHFRDFQYVVLKEILALHDRRKSGKSRNFNHTKK